MNGNANVENPASLLNHESCTDDEAIVFTLPPVPRYAKPCAELGRLSVPILAVVADAYPNDPSVVEELLNVLSAVNVFAVYVLAIVVLPLMKAFVVSLMNVVLSESAPPVFCSPEPRRDVNVEPPIAKFVVDAVINEAYVVDEKLND